MNQIERESRVLKVAQDVFGDGAATLDAAASIRGIPGWDSLRHLNFILAIEDAFDCSLEPDDIERMDSPRQTALLVGKARGDADAMDA